MPEVTLNKEQQLAQDGIKEWYSADNRSRILISGYPGTGKTFTVVQSLQSLDVGISELAIAAPSHKAKNVIRDYLTGIGMPYSVFTVHSLLGLSAEIEDSGKKSFTGVSSKAPIEQFKYLWLDECSMLDTPLHSKIENSHCQVLYTGDQYQLMPVGEKSFPVFDQFEKHKLPFYQLTEPVRYSGAIKDFVYDALWHVKDERLFEPMRWLPMTNDCTYVGDWFSQWIDDDSDRVILTFTNQHVHQINKRCRDYVYGDDAPEFVENERLITYAPINDPDGNPMIPNGTEVEVRAVKERRIIGQNIGFDGFDVFLKGYSWPATVISRRDEAMYQDYLGVLFAKAKAKEIRWSDYYFAKELSADIRPVYCQTIHKSQGSGYQTVYVIDSFRWLKDRQLQPRLHYVAASRAKERLFYSSRL